MGTWDGVVVHLNKFEFRSRNAGFLLTLVKICQSVLKKICCYCDP